MINAATTVVHGGGAQGDFNPHTPTMPHSQVTHAGMPKVVLKNALRPKPVQNIDPLYNADTCVGGLVCTWKSLQRVPGHMETGAQVSFLMDKYFDAHGELENQLHDAIGQDGVDVEKLEVAVEELRNSCS